MTSITEYNKEDLGSLKEKRYPLTRGWNPVSATGGRAPVRFSSIQQRKSWARDEAVSEAKLQKFRQLSCGCLRFRELKSGNILKKREAKVSGHSKAQICTKEAHYDSQARDQPRLEPGQV